MGTQCIVSEELLSEVMNGSYKGTFAWGVFDFGVV